MTGGPPPPARTLATSPSGGGNIAACFSPRRGEYRRSRGGGRDLIPRVAYLFGATDLARDVPTAPLPGTIFERYVGAMACLGCGGISGPLCPDCRQRLVAAPPRPIGGLVVGSVWLHEGPAPRLVHRLKYRGDPLVARLVVDKLARLLPPTTRCLVPIPRTMVRRWRYGVDPALELSRALSDVTHLPLIEALSAPFWWPHRAGRNRAGYGPPSLRPVRSTTGAVIVDDVVTTGETIRSAARQLGNAVGAVTITSSL